MNSNKQKDAYMVKLSKQEVPPPTYTAEFTGAEVDALEGLLEYSTDDIEFANFVEHLMNQVDLMNQVESDTDDWENWTCIDDIPKELMEEFEGVSSHIYHTSMQIYKIVAPLINQAHKDRQEGYSANNAK
jgi:hypothetical protein